MRIMLLFSFLCFVAIAEDSGSVSDLLSTSSLWGQNSSAFLSVAENVSFREFLGDDHRQTLSSWYLWLIHAQLPTNDIEYARWADIKGTTLWMFAKTSGVEDSTNIWFAVADARGALAPMACHLGNPSTNVVIVVTTNLVAASDALSRSVKANKDAALSTLLDSMDSCLEDFLHGRTYQALSSSERCAIKSNLLQRAGISSLEAAKMDL